MKRWGILSAGAIGVGLLALSSAQSSQKPQVATEASELDDMHVHSAGEIAWKQGPESLPPGAEYTVLEGDPSKPGPFVFRVKVPDGYTIPPHTHPRAERVTVIAGTFHIAMTDKVDMSAGQEMPAGSFGYWPAGMKHFAWVSSETIVQFHGYGPWVINYLNPADDPRNAKRP